VVGGVGSGKTTQLLVARDKLKEIADAKSSFIDVGQLHDLGRLQSGVLLVLAGLALIKTLPLEISDGAKEAKEFFKRIAHGWTEWVDPVDVDDYEISDWEVDDSDPSPDWTVPVRRTGILVPPYPPLHHEIQEKAAQLRKLVEAVTPLVPHIVLLFDSLDRVTTLLPFAEVVEQDIRAIKSLGVGVVVVGPLRTMFASDRPIVDHFDYFYHQPSVDVQQDEAGQEFLFRVLRRRAGREILGDKAAHRIVRWSGGVLRDLISLSRSAGEEAYTQGADKILTVHVDAAADAFGRTLMLGLTSDEIKVLQKVRAKGSFVPTSDSDIALLVTRRVLEYGPTRYAVHPTIAPLLELLEQLATAS
jgi:hypothetical protein